MKLSQAGWREISSYLDEGLDLPVEHRAAWVETLPNLDSALRRRLRDVLCQPLNDEFLDTLPSLAPASEGGEIAGIGHYHLIRELGRGGMGVVWLAQRNDGLLSRQVALKLPHSGIKTEWFVKRFAQEREILASLTHPNIARLYDVGVTEEGQPFIALEYVEGTSLTEYCDRERLGIPERLNLFLKVLAGVHYAHAHLVLHRDLKPSNILVAEGEVKLLDFGIAKLMSGGEARETELTEAGGRALTLNYASPEQIFGLPMTTSSDVYSLGVILFELLTGSTPRGDLAGLPYVEALRRIGEQEVKAPSVGLQRSSDLKRIADLRQTDPAKLPKLLERELEWITMKALEGERSRRYATVNGLALDLKRYLDGEPVEAAPPSTAYRLGKLARRYRLWLSIASAFATLLIVGIVISVSLAVRARRAEAESRAINDFLETDLLGQASTYNQSAKTKPDPNITVRTALDRAAAGIEGKFPRQPLLEASIRHQMGVVYEDLAVYPQAQLQYERALSIRRRELGAKHEQTFMTMSSLASVYERSGQLQRAEPLYREALVIGRHYLGEENPNTLKTTNGLAAVYFAEGKYAESEALLVLLLPREEQVFGPQHLQTLRAMGNLANAYVMQHKDSLAEPLMHKTLDLKRHALGEENPETLDTLSNLAEVYVEHGDYARAEPLLATALAAYKRTLGDSHPQTVNATNTLGQLYWAEGNFQQAEASFQQAVDAGRRAGRAEHPITLESLYGLAQAYDGEGRHDQAEKLFAQLLESQRRILGSDHPDTLNTVASLAEVQLTQRKYPSAESNARQALASYQRLAPDTWERYAAETILGASLTGEKKFSQAEPLLVSGYQGLKAREQQLMASDRSTLTVAGERIVHLYRDWGKPEKAASWEQILHETKSPQVAVR